MLNPPNNAVVLGKFGSTYGIRGWLRLFSSTEIAENIFDYQPWFICQNGTWQKVELESWKHHNAVLVVKLKGVDVRETASLLTNLEIVIDSTGLPALSNNEYYWKDLIGCRVLAKNQYDMGLVTEIMETGSNDVLVVKANLKDAFGMKERLIPFIEQQVICSIDLESRIIVVDWDPNF